MDELSMISPLSMACNSKVRVSKLALGDVQRDARGPFRRRVREAADVAGSARSRLRSRYGSRGSQRETRADLTVEVAAEVDSLCDQLVK